MSDEPGFGVTRTPTETIPVYIDWPPVMWGEPPKVGDRYALEVYDVQPSKAIEGNVVIKLRPVKL